jgi:hypothetical protein
MSARHAVARNRTPHQTRGPWWTSRWLLVGTVAAVAAIVGVMVIVGLTGSSPGQPRTAAAASNLAPATVVDPATHPTVATLATVGMAGATDPFAALPATIPTMAFNGHPLVAYVGAEFCPFCASRRWSLVVALSRFGTFTNLGLATSSSTDIHPSTHSVSFHGSTFTSSYVSFSGVETETTDRQPLDTPTVQVVTALAQFDGPPLTAQVGSIPFLDIGNRFVSIGGGYSPALLQGMSWQQIADVIRDPNTQVGHAVMADANIITAAICSVTGGQPNAVCAAAPVPEILATLPR